MNIFSPLDLIRAHSWSEAFFATYALSLSFFEAVVLDALVRQNVARTLILADVSGVRAAVEEFGSRYAGRGYEIEPVAVDPGCFHPKFLALTSSTEAHLVVGSGNLTFGGWGSNLECVEHLHPGIAADAFDDAAGFLELLATVNWVKHDAKGACTILAERLRRAAATGVRTGSIRLLHSLGRPILQRLIEIADELGGAERLAMAAPFHDGVALDRLCDGLGLDRGFVHSHNSGTVAGSFGRNWPAGAKARVEPVEVGLFAEDKRRLHAKAIEIVCRHGRVVLSGSANATMAALDVHRNVELSVARIQRNSVTGWRLAPASAPAVVEPAVEPEKNHAKEGVLRAVLEGSTINGRILTKFPAGNATVFRVTASSAIDVGGTVVTDEGRFTLIAHEIEREAWTAHRLIIKVASSAGAVAHGFVSFADFAEIRRHLGSVSTRMFAMLAGAETPEDVVAVMSWFYEHPEQISFRSTGGGGQHHRHVSGEVTVAGLLAPDAFETSLRGSGDSTDAAARYRFMDLVLACFRQPRGPIETEDNSEEDAPLENGPASPSARARAASSLERHSNFFEKLLDGMISRSADGRSHAFWLAHYVCDRLEPDAVIVRSYLDKVIAAFKNQPPTLADQEAIAAAVLVWATHLPTGADPSSVPRITRRKLLRMEVDVAGPLPDMKLVQGFARVLGPDFDFNTLWENIRRTRAPQEEIKKFRLAGIGAQLDAAFPYLGSLQELSKITPAGRKRIEFMIHYSSSCPRCYIALPTGEASRLREAGIASNLNCCSRILLCEEI